MTGGNRFQSAIDLAGGNRFQLTVKRTGLSAIAWLVVLFAAGQGAADWEVYVSGGLGISAGIVDTDGLAPINANDPNDLGIPLTGEDDDSGPLIEGAVGLSVPMDEIVPREWLMDIRLPNWPVRLEIEAAGLREFDLATDQSGGRTKFFTKWKTTTSFVNAWLDIPLIEMWRPVQYLGGLGRQPRLRQWLEPGSFYIGSGIGFSHNEIDGTSNVLNGSDDFFDFAWNVGAGFNYALTDSVDLSAGYRYVGLGNQSVDILNGATDTNRKLKFTPQVHELRVQIRVEVYEFLSPWR